MTADARAAFRVAAVQTVSGGDVAANLAQAEPLIGEAAAAGARLVVLPEYFGIFGARATDKLDVRETDGEGPQQAFLARLAQRARHLAGRRHRAARLRRPRARAQRLPRLRAGRARVARYDKIHLFAFARGDERYDEGRTIEPGTAPVTVALPCGRVGLSVCYDLRFPELYRGMGDARADPGARGVHGDDGRGALAPAAARTGGREPVLRARRGAGRRAPRRAPHLRSLGADRPVGNGASRSATHGPGFIVGDVDPARLAEVREQLPALAHRVF